MHLNVLDITERSTPRSSGCGRRRELLPYLHQQRIFTRLNHVASRVNGQITAPHIAALMPWVDALETSNGSRLPTQNQTAELPRRSVRQDRRRRQRFAHAPRHRPHLDRSPERAATARSSWQALRHGRVRVEGQQGNYFTMASDIVRLASGFYQEKAAALCRKPLLLAARTRWCSAACSACR